MQRPLRLTAHEVGSSLCATWGASASLACGGGSGVAGAGSAAAKVGALTDGAATVLCIPAPLAQADRANAASAAPICLHAARGKVGSWRVARRSLERVISPARDRRAESGLEAGRQWARPFLMLSTTAATAGRY